MAVPALFSDFREVPRIHAGDICTQHCIFCITAMKAFNNSVQDHIVDVDFLIKSLH